MNSKHIVRADHDEIVFRNRNQSYGSFILRKALPRDTARAFVLSVVGVGALLLLPALRFAIDDSEPVDVEMRTEITLDDYVLDNADRAEPEPEVLRAEMPAAPRREQVQFVEPTVVEAIHAPEDVVLTDVSQTTIEVGSQTSSGDDNPTLSFEDFDHPDGVGTGQVELAIVVPTEPDPDAYEPYDEEATPVNLAQLKELVEYPQQARDNGIHGRVVLRVLVGTNGKYVRHIVTRTPHPWLTVAVEEHIQRLQFTPAIRNRQPVMMWVNVPINFTQPQ